MIVAHLDAFRAETLIDTLATVRARLHPFLHDRVHLAVDFAVRFTSCWVVEDSANVVEDLGRLYLRVVPTVNHARCDVLQNHSHHLPSRLVQDVAEMVFAQHGVCGITAGLVVTHEVLLLLTC